MKIGQHHQTIKVFNVSLKNFKFLSLETAGTTQWDDLCRYVAVSKNFHYIRRNSKVNSKVNERMHFSFKFKILLYLTFFFRTHTYKKTILMLYR